MNRKRITKKATLALVAMMTVTSVVGCSQSNNSNKNQQGSNQKTEQKTEQKTDKNTNSSLSSSTIFKDMKTTDIDGNKVDKSIFSKYKLTMVNVWNTGCSPCISEIPTLDRLNKEYREKGVSIKGMLLESGIGLTDEEKATAKEILSKANATYQQLTVTKDMVEKDDTLLLQAFPTTFFIDKDGNIVDSIEGSNDYDCWKAKIDEVLKKVEANE